MRDYSGPSRWGLRLIRCCVLRKHEATRNTQFVLRSTPHRWSIPMALLTFNSHEARTVAAIAERLFPADESGPGATEIGVLNYIDQALAGAYDDAVETYRLGLAALDRL